MANKSNKNGQLSWRKEAKGKKPWPNLPHQLLSCISRQAELLNNISYPGSIKAFRLASRHCQSSKNPQLAELVEVGISDRTAQREITKRYINIHFREECYWPHCGTHPEFWDPGYMPVYHVGCGHGAVVAQLSSPSKYIVRHIASRIWWTIKDWDVNIPFKFALLYEWSILIREGCLLVFTGISNPAFAFYWQKSENASWLKRDCTIIDPNDPKQQFMKFGAAIACKGKIYALSVQGTVAVIEVIGSDLAITAISKSRAVPSVNAQYFRECLIESNGEVLLVFLIFRKTMTIVDHAEVFKLEVPKLRWMKMEELGDRALFVEPESCIWVTASEFGCKSNCVFFSTTIDEWCTFDLKSGTISSNWSKYDLAC